MFTSAHVQVGPKGSQHICIEVSGQINSLDTSDKTKTTHIQLIQHTTHTQNTHTTHTTHTTHATHATHATHTRILIHCAGAPAHKHANTHTYMHSCMEANKFACRTLYPRRGRGGKEPLNYQTRAHMHVRCEPQNKSTTACIVQRYVDVRHYLADTCHISKVAALWIWVLYYFNLTWWLLLFSLKDLDVLCVRSEFH